jgi:hypothetical protein
MPSPNGASLLLDPSLFLLLPRFSNTVILNLMCNSVLPIPWPPLQPTESASEFSLGWSGERNPRRANERTCQPVKRATGPRRSAARIAGWTARRSMVLGFRCASPYGHQAKPPRGVITIARGKAAASPLEDRPRFPQALKGRQVPWARRSWGRPVGAESSGGLRSQGDALGYHEVAPLGLSLLSLMPMGFRWASP